MTCSSLADKGRRAIGVDFNQAIVAAIGRAITVPSIAGPWAFVIETVYREGCVKREGCATLGHHR